MIGTLDQTGIYTPSPAGHRQGPAGQSVSLPIKLKQVDGQWRIDSLPNGLLISRRPVPRQYYSQYFVYFYDLAEQLLVPDPRYSPLRDPAQLADLADDASSRPGHAGAVVAAPRCRRSANRSQIRCTSAADPLVEIPGASQLDAGRGTGWPRRSPHPRPGRHGHRDATITDGGEAVDDPAGGSDQFTATQFENAVSPANPARRCTHLRHGGVVDDAGQALPGGVGSGPYHLGSVALATSPVPARCRWPGRPVPRLRCRLLRRARPAAR